MSSCGENDTKIPKNSKNRRNAMVVDGIEMLNPRSPSFIGRNRIDLLFPEKSAR